MANKNGNVGHQMATHLALNKGTLLATSEINNDVQSNEGGL